jgi:hypothetical protein
MSTEKKSPEEIRAEKLAEAMKKLGSKHLLHKSRHVRRKERPHDPAAADVRRTFDRVLPGWDEHESERFVPLRIKASR